MPLQSAKLGLTSAGGPFDDGKNKEQHPIREGVASRFLVLRWSLQEAPSALQDSKTPRPQACWRGSLLHVSFTLGSVRIGVGVAEAFDEAVDDLQVWDLTLVWWAGGDALAGGL